MKTIAKYKGWTIEENKHGMLMASPDLVGSSFMFIAESIEHAKQVIDKRTAC